MPGEWPTEALSAAPAETPVFSAFSTVGRWAAKASSVLTLPKRLINQYWGAQQIVAVPITSDNGSQKKRLVDAGVIDEPQTPSPSQRAHANATRRRFLTRNASLSPNIWSPSPEKKETASPSPPQFCSPLALASFPGDIEASPLDVDSDDSLDFSLSEVLTSTPPRNPQTGSPIQFPWESPEKPSGAPRIAPTSSSRTAKDISNTQPASGSAIRHGLEPNPVTPMRRHLLKLQLRAHYDTERTYAVDGSEPSPIAEEDLSDLPIASSSPFQVDVDSESLPDAEDEDMSDLPLVSSSPFQSDVDDDSSDLPLPSSSPFQSDVGSSPTRLTTSAYQNDLSFLSDAPPRKTVRWTTHAVTKSFYIDEKISEMLDSSLESITSSPARPTSIQNDEDEDVPNVDTQINQDNVFAEIGELLGISEEAWNSPDNSLEELQISTELLGDLHEDLKKKLALAPPSPPPLKSLVAPLTTEESDALKATAAGTAFGKNLASYVVDEKLSTLDFATLLPGLFNGNPKAWLNDNIVNEYLAILVKEKKAKMGYEHVRGGQAPAVHAFSSFWYTTMKTRPKSVERWSSRFQLGGKQYLDAELLIYPICDGGHWRLLAIKPKDRVIEYLDSLGFSGKPYVAKAFEYLKMELKENFNASEWTVVEKQRSSQQLNGSDCGVFTVLNALVLLRGEEAERVIACDGMADARERIATTLIAGHPTTEMD